MKKKLLGFIVLLGILIFQINNSNYSNAACEFTTGSASVSEMVSGCMDETSVVAVKGSGLVEGEFKDKINNWTNNIALFLALLSVGAVIYGGLMMTLSTGDDEKIKKAKDIVKWSLLGFLAVVLATTIATLIINLIYGFATAT